VGERSVLNAIPPELEAIICQIPNRSTAKVKHVEQLEGLTNQNYAVTLDGECLVVRISRENAAALGINREIEWEALLAASEAGIGLEVVHVVLPEGHLVTRYIEDHHWTVEVFPDSIECVLAAGSLSLRLPYQPQQHQSGD